MMMEGMDEMIQGEKGNVDMGDLLQLGRMCFRNDMMLGLVALEVAILMNHDLYSNWSQVYQGHMILLELRIPV